MDLDEELEVKRSSNRGTLIAFGVVAVAVVAGLLVLRQRTKAHEREVAMHSAANGWNSLQRCLIGPPLAAGENPTLRVHRVQVNRDPVPAGGSASDQNDRWPYRCGVYATALRDAAGTLETTNPAMHAVRGAAEHLRANLLRGQTETTAVRTHETTAVDALFAAMGHVTLPAPENYTGPAAPTVGAMIARDDLHPLFTNPAGGEIQVLVTDRSPQAELHVAIAQSSVYGCEFLPGADPAHQFTTARCSPTGAPVAGSQVEAAMFDADDAYTSFPPVRVGSGRDTKVTNATATPDARPWAFRGSVTADGTITQIDSGGVEFDEAAATGRWRWTQWRATGARTTGALTLPPESSRPDILPDRVLYLASSEPGHGPARLAMYSRALSAGASPFGPAVDAGTVPEGSRIAGHCRTEHALGVAVNAEHGVVMMMSYGPTWRAPSEEFSGHFDTINCTATDVVATWTVARPPTVHQARCTATGCTHTDERLPTLASAFARSGGNPEVADLNGNVMMVWSPEEGGLRMRMAPIGHLNAAHDVVLYDDHAHLGGWVQSPNLYVRGGAAVVVFTDSERDNDKRPMAIRILPDGSFVPVAPAPAS